MTALGVRLWCGSCGLSVCSSVKPVCPSIHPSSRLSPLIWSRPWQLLVSLLLNQFSREEFLLMLIFFWMYSSANLSLKFPWFFGGNYALGDYDCNDYTFFSLAPPLCQPIYIYIRQLAATYCVICCQYSCSSAKFVHIFARNTTHNWVTMLLCNCRMCK